MIHIRAKGVTNGTLPRDIAGTAGNLLLKNLGLGKSSANTERGSGSDDARDSGSASRNEAPTLRGLYEQFLQVYTPEKLAYEPAEEEKLRSDIAGWLRPSYDAAIETRQEQTDAYHAELDADAFARGMGESTYVTDVKARQKDAEARDVKAINSEYTAALGKYLTAALEEERDRAFEAEKINSERLYEAQRAAYSAALGSYGSYGGGSGGGSSGSGRSSGSSSAVATTSAENVETFLRSLTPGQRQGVYAASNEENKRYRDEILASVGVTGYLHLQQRYPVFE